MNVADLTVAAHRLLDDKRRPHAFGGALALAYYAEPRGTLDVDVNVFVPFADASDVVAELAVLGLVPDHPEVDWSPIAGVRLHPPSPPVASLAPLDVFFSIDPRYDEIAARAKTWPFGPDEIPLPFLSAEDLAVFKLSFGRPKDWVDLRSLIDGWPDLDLEIVEGLLLALRGPSMHPRLARLRSMTREAGC